MRISTITINGEFWTEERLVKYVSKKFNLPIKMDQPAYKLNRILCNLSMANFNGKKITLKELDNFLIDEYKKILLQEKLNSENLENKSLDDIGFEEQSKKLR